MRPAASLLALLCLCVALASCQTARYGTASTFDNKKSTVLGTAKVRF